MLFFFSNRIKLLNCPEIQRNSQITNEAPNHYFAVKINKTCMVTFLTASNVPHTLKYLSNVKMQ